jgi:hypothetical protein
MADHVLVVLADEGYLDPARQIFANVHFDAGWSGDLLLLAQDVPEPRLAPFRERGILVQPIERWHPEPRIGRRSSTLLSKFQLFSPAFRRWRNVVYVDADMLFDASLERLARVRGLWAVSDRNDLAWQFGGGADDPEAWRELCARFDPRAEAFNTGLLAFSTDLIGDDTVDALHALFARYGRMQVNADQSLLNLHFYGRWQRLPDFYAAMRNMPARHFRVRKERFRAIGRHFPGPPALWDARNPQHERWRANLARFDELDAHRPQPPRAAWSGFEIWRTWHWLRLRRALVLGLAPLAPAVERARRSPPVRRVRGLIRRGARRRTPPAPGASGRSGAPPRRSPRARRSRRRSRASRGARWASARA